MSIKNTVKVMNFHALLRVNNARKNVDHAFNYERNLKYIISSIVNNRIFKQENLSLSLEDNAKELNIYIGSDLGFCSFFNSDVMNYLISCVCNARSSALSHFFNSRYCGIFVRIDFSFSRNFIPMFSFLYLNAFFASFIYEMLSTCLIFSYILL